MSISTFVLVILSLTAVVDALLALLLFNLCRGRNLVDILVMHLSFILMWALSIIYILLQSSLLAAQLAYVAGMGIALTKYLFVQTYTSPSSIPHPHALIPIFVGGALSLGVFMPGFYFVDFTVIEHLYIISTPGPGALLYLGGLCFFLLHPMFTLYHHLARKTLTPEQYSQTKVLLVGISFFFVIGFLTNSLLPVVFHIHHLNGIGPTFSLILAAFIIHNLYRYRFLEIQHLLHRGLVFSIILASVLGAYVALLQLVTHLVHTKGHVAITLTSALTTTAGIFVIPIIDSYLRRVTHPLFFSDHYEYSTALYNLSNTLQKSLNLTEIIDVTTDGLRELFGAEWVRITPHAIPALHQSAALTIALPARDTTRTAIAWLYLGHKYSGHNFTRQDTQLISTLSNQLAVAIERAELYEEVRTYSKHLEAKVAARTEELVTVQEQQRVMISNISHSLQTPLTVVQSELELLPHNIAASPHLSALRKSLGDLATFVSSLLKLARLENQTNEPSGCVPISQLLDDIFEYGKVIAEAQQVTVTAALARELYVHGDRRQLEEAILSIFSNALKYMRSDGERTVHLHLTAATQQVVLTIRDCGIGIAPADQARIFNRFYRSTRPETSTITGSGLGLTIAKTIVEQHRGTLTVDSTVGVGSTFRISLPRLSKPTAD